MRRGWVVANAAAVLVSAGTFYERTAAAGEITYNASYSAEYSDNVRQTPTNHQEAAANLVGLATIARSQQLHDKAIELSREAIYHAQTCGDVRHVVAGRRILGILE